MKNTLKMTKTIRVFLRAFFITLIDLGVPIRYAQAHYTAVGFGLNQLFDIKQNINFVSRIFFGERRNYKQKIPKVAQFYSRKTMK